MKIPDLLGANSFGSGEVVASVQLSIGLNEAKATSEFLNILRKKGGWRYKIPDIGNTIKPFDIVGVYDGVFVSIEVKVYKNKKIKNIYTYGISKLELHQHLNLYETKMFAGISLVGVYVKATGELFLYNFIIDE